MAWQNPVYDRAFADVEEARRKIREWTEEPSPQIADLKGCLNVSDLNRIEGNMAYLAETLNGLMYSVTISVRLWNRSEMPLQKDIRRILFNLTALTAAYYQPEEPAVPPAMSTYEEINAVEYLLELLKRRLDQELDEEINRPAGRVYMGGAPSMGAETVVYAWNENGSDLPKELTFKGTVRIGAAPVGSAAVTLSTEKEGAS